jgi:predicted transcriptional regulator
MRETLQDQTHAILPIVHRWFEEAKTREITVFNFPPKRKPAQDQIRKLGKGSTCLLFLYDDRQLVGEFKVTNVKKVNFEEFQVLKEKAFEVGEARFPKQNEWCWVIEFTDFRAFERPLSEDELRRVIAEVYGKSASMRPLHFTQVIDEKLVNTVKTVMLILQFLKKD